MESVKLKRGGGDVTLEKVPGRFAVRMRQGRASSSRALAASCGESRVPLSHVDSIGSERMDLFQVADERALEDTMDELRKAPEAQVVSHVYRLDDTPGGAVVPTGAMTITFEQEIGEEQRQELLAEFGLEVVKEIPYMANAYAVRLTSASKVNPLKIASQLQGRKGILVAEPDLAFQRSLKFVPSSPLYRNQWHLNNRGGAVGLLAGADVRAEAAWEVTLGDRDVRICVIDDGVDLQHPDLGLPGKIVAPRDFGEDDHDPSPVAADDDHGTACAGVAVAEGFDAGVLGLAPRCSLMPVRMGNWLTDAAVEDMFQHAIDQHADVVSCSWSAAIWNFPLSARAHGIIHHAATAGRRNGKGCVILFAAGNEDRPLKGTKNGQVSHQGFALHPDVIAVAACNSLDRRSSYSNHGPELSLCAPSSGAPGHRIFTTDRRGAPGYSPTDYADDFGGTSSSTPLAAGLAGLILSIDPELSSAEVRTIMMETADKIDPAGGAYVNGHSPRYGHGRINAERAVEMARGGGAQRLPEVLSIEHRLHRDVPDLGDVRATIPFPLDVAALAVEVAVDVQHTWSGDLRLVLRSPEGREVVLQDRIGGSTQDVVRTFRSSDEPQRFAPLLGRPAKGDWQLDVYDMQRHDVGVLRKWTIAVTY